MMVTMGAQTAFAEKMPDLRDEDGTLMVDVTYFDEDLEVPITGAELTLYKVADLTVSNGYALYRLTEPFSDSGVDLGSMTAARSIEAAGILYDIVTEKKLEGKMVISEDGIVDFGEVSHGMYLIAQTGARDEARDYKRIDPYLVMAPQPLTDIDETGENDWEYDVLSIPKMVEGDYEPPDEEDDDEPEKKKEKEKDKEKVKEPEKEKEKVTETEKGKRAESTKTGDETRLYVWVSLIPIALSAMILIGMLRRRSRR